MKLIFTCLAIFIACSINAQPRLPVIRATKRNVSINDGGYFDKDAWTLSPQARPDVFTADRTRKAKWVVYYTDIDSIRVKVNPGTIFDFVVLLNGKDSCFTRIASAIAPAQVAPDPHTAPDTIPFSLTTFNAISVQSILNNTDTVNLHFDLGSFDFRLTKNAILHKTSLLPDKAGALAGNKEPDYRHLNKVNTIQMGNRTWNSPEITVTSLTAHDMDGRFGWNLFEGMVVEINYDRSILVIHATLPITAKTFFKSPLFFMRSFVCAKGAFVIANKKYTGTFLLDTGSDRAMILDSAWASNQAFPNNLPLLSSTVVSDPRGAQYKTKTVEAPQFTINQCTLNNIPAMMLSNKNPLNFEVNYLGNDLLKRFNILLDFKNDNLYLKPNRLKDVPYRTNS